jgi:hypothetical protein
MATSLQPPAWGVRRNGELIRRFGQPHAQDKAERWAADAAEHGEPEADRRRNARS